MIVLILVVGVLLYFYGQDRPKHAERYASVTGKGYRPRPFDLGRGALALPASSCCSTSAVVLALPLLALFWMALTPFIAPISCAVMKSVSLRPIFMRGADVAVLSLGWPPIR